MLNWDMKSDKQTTVDPDKQTTVATFSDIEKAEGVKKRLAEAGIPAEVLDESNLQKFWFFSKPLAADKVVVDQHDFDKAREFL